VRAYIHKGKCSYIYISICIYTVFLKNIFSENRITLRKVHLKHGNSKFQTDLTRAFERTKLMKRTAQRPKTVKIQHFTLSPHVKLHAFSALKVHPSFTGSRDR
jgi:hypothetical protein